MQVSGQRAIIVAAVGFFVVGLLIGWLAIGWWLWPVKWYDADPIDLRESARRDYVAMVADSYAVTRDLQMARQRLAGWPDDEVSRTLADLNAGYTKQGRGAEAQRIKDLTNSLGVKPAQGTPAAAVISTPAAAPTTAPETKSTLSTILAVCGILVAVLLVIAGGALGWSYMQKRRASQLGKLVQPVMPAPAMGEMPAGPQALGTFVTSYNLGDSGYDDCFPIETSGGEFLGECGVGVSETLGEGDPPAVTAFEVWLFDKSDIRTVTKVLMSEHAYNDEELRAKLAPKGELVLAQPGQVITLETAALQVQAEIKDLAYAAGEAPEQGQFARLTMELVAMAKEPGVAPQA